MDNFTTDINGIKKRKELSVNVADIKKPKDTGYLLSGMASVDKLLHGIRFGELTILFSRTGEGKSTFLGQMLVSFLNQNEKIWLFNGEFTNWRSKENLYTQIANKNNLDIIYNSDIDVNEIELKEGVEDKIDKWVDNRFFIHSEETLIDKDVMKSMSMARHRDGVRIFVVDNETIITKTNNMGSKWDEQKQMILELNDFAIKNSCHVFLVCHAKKPSKGEEHLSKYSILGSSDISNIGHNLISVEKITPDMKIAQDLFEKYGQHFNAKVTSHKNRKYGTQKETFLGFDSDSKIFYDVFTKKELHVKNGWEDTWSYDYKNKRVVGG